MWVLFFSVYRPEWVHITLAFIHLDIKSKQTVKKTKPAQVKVASIVGLILIKKLANLKKIMKISKTKRTSAFVEEVTNDDFLEL